MIVVCDISCPWSFGPTFALISSIVFPQCTDHVMSNIMTCFKDMWDLSNQEPFLTDTLDVHGLGHFHWNRISENKRNIVCTVSVRENFPSYASDKHGVMMAWWRSMSLMGLDFLKIHTCGMRLDYRKGRILYCSFGVWRVWIKQNPWPIRPVIFPDALMGKKGSSLWC